MKIYWHRELPPANAVAIGEHTIEGQSAHVVGSHVTGELWDRCAEDLANGIERRLGQEAARLGGHIAHVLDEHIDVRHDPTRAEAWLHGRYTYMLYR